MKQESSHRVNTGEGILSSRHSKELLRYRADLKELLYTMETDQTLNAPHWQIDSIRKTLQEIEQKLQTNPAEGLTFGHETLRRT